MFSWRQTTEITESKINYNLYNFLNYSKDWRYQNNIFSFSKIKKHDKENSLSYGMLKLCSYKNIISSKFKTIIFNQSM